MMPLTRNDAVARLMAWADEMAFELDDNATDLLADALGLLAGGRGVVVQDLVERLASASAMAAHVAGVEGTA